VLREGDGVISGRIQDANGPLGGATIDATDGTTKISTVSLTDNDVGFFALRSLPTPATTPSRSPTTATGRETQTFNLASAQQLSDAVITVEVDRLGPRHREPGRRRPARGCEGHRHRR
jgi:hypothetical protein